MFISIHRQILSIFIEKYDKYIFNESCREMRLTLLLTHNLLKRDFNSKNLFTQIKIRYSFAVVCEIFPK